MDRNLQIMPLVDLQTPSLSARRAWIEIADVVSVQHGCEVALRKESVDRNIRNNGGPGTVHIVALRKESVDRNLCGTSKSAANYRRSPQGERG